MTEFSLFGGLSLKQYFEVHYDNTYELYILTENKDFCLLYCCIFLTFSPQHIPVGSWILSF